MRRLARSSRGWRRHAILPLERWSTAAVALVLGIAGHTVGWPIVRGGSQRLAESLAGYLRSLGGEVVTGWRVESVDELPDARAVLLDVTPRQVVRLAGHRLSAGYARRLGRYRYGAGVFKLDWALNGPIPWRRAACARAGTVHLGGTLEEVAASESAIGRGEHPERPFVLLSQPSLFDPTRAPAGGHTAWAYCHVPNASTVDMTARIEGQVERFAPGFRDTIRARHVMAPADFQSYNENYIGGDINGGSQDIRQLFTRPVAQAGALFDAGGWALSMLVIDAPRWGRAWTVRIPCCAGRVETDVEFGEEMVKLIPHRFSVFLRLTSVSSTSACPGAVVYR